MPQPRTVAVLGPIPHDRIITHNGEEFEKYGCALYTAVALAALLEPTDRVALVSHVRKEDEGPIKEILSAFPTIDTSLITSDADQGDVIELRYVEHNTRVERQTRFMNPILPADVDPVLEAEAFVCVPITDYEVSQPTLRHIKEHSSGTILLDAHGPAVALGRTGHRHSRVWADRDTWLPYIDILKMNLEEASSTWMRESADVDEESRLAVEDLPELAEYCLARGLGGLCVTLDEEGCVAFYTGPDGAVVQETVGRIKVENVVDTTGAGDSFAAGLAFGFLEYGNYVMGARFGNAMGAQRCSSSELDVYLARPDTERQLLDTYGPHR